MHLKRGYAFTLSVKVIVIQFILCCPQTPLGNLLFLKSYVWHWFKIMSNNVNCCLQLVTMPYCLFLALFYYMSDHF